VVYAVNLCAVLLFLQRLLILCGILVPAVNSACSRSVSRIVRNVFREVLIDISDFR